MAESYARPRPVRFSGSVADDPLVMHSRLESFRTDSQRGYFGSYGGYGSLCDVGHQGLLHDKEFGPAATGLVHNRRRTLNPLLGRLMQRDPLGYPDGMNGYEYQTSIPLNRIDDQGLWSRTISEGAETIQDESPGYRLKVKIEYDKTAIPENASHIVQVNYARVVGMDMTCTLLFDDVYYVSDVWNWGPLKFGLGNEYLIDNRASFSKGNKREQIEWYLLYVEVHSEIGILTTAQARKSLGPALIGKRAFQSANKRHYQVLSQSMKEPIGYFDEEYLWLSDKECCDLDENMARPWGAWTPTPGESLRLNVRGMIKVLP